MKALDTVRDAVRKQMDNIAKLLNSLSGGKLSPNTVTVVGLLMHLPIAVLIANGDHALAAVLLVVFGLFDALDGSLARLQKRSSNAGMLLDASTDRFKEVMLYSGVAAFFVSSPQTSHLAIWAVIACGASLSVSYVKAKGETAVAGQKLSANEVNRLFQDGFARFEIRMAMLVVALLFGWLDYIIVLIALLSSYTAVQRLVNISRKL